MNVSEKTEMFIHFEDQAAGYLDILKSNTVTLQFFFGFFFTFAGFIFLLPFLFPVVFRCVEVQICYTTLCYFGAKILDCTRHNYDMIQINAITAGAEVAMVSLTVSLFKLQSRDQIKKARLLWSLKGQTAETKATVYLRAELK